jgi:hypothetical protein
MAMLQADLPTPPNQIRVKTMPETVEGGCMCGAVRYSMQSPPLVVHCCHCTECQRQNGSAFAVNAMIEHDRIEIIRGETVAGHMPAESGGGQTVHRCGNCGVILWSHYSGAGPAIAFVRAGTLDDPSVCPPDIHIFTRSKQPWVVLPEGAKAVDVYYNAAEHWSGASLERLAAVA